MNVRRAPALIAVVVGAILVLGLTGCGSAGAGKAGPAESPKLATTPSTTNKTTAVTALDGTWEVSYTRKEFLAAGADPSEDIPENWGHFTMEFHRGDYVATASVASGSSSGTYVVTGDKVTLYPTAGCCVGEVGTLTWSVYRDQLTFTGNIPTGFRVKPWRQIGP